MSQSNDIKEKAIVYLTKNIQKARIDADRALHKSGAAHELHALIDKIEMLEYLREIVERKEGRV
jgi:hypothetical protein